VVIKALRTLILLGGLAVIEAGCTNVPSSADATATTAPDAGTVTTAPDAATATTAPGSATSGGSDQERISRSVAAVNPSVVALVAQFAVRI